MGQYLRAQMFFLQIRNGWLPYHVHSPGPANGIRLHDRIWGNPADGSAIKIPPRLLLRLSLFRWIAPYATRQANAICRTWAMNMVRKPPVTNLQEEHLCPKILA